MQQLHQLVKLIAFVQWVAEEEISVLVTIACSGQATASLECRPQVHRQSQFQTWPYT